MYEANHPEDESSQPNEDGNGYEDEGIGDHWNDDENVQGQWCDHADEEPVDNNDEHEGEDVEDQWDDYADNDDENNEEWDDDDW